MKKLLKKPNIYYLIGVIVLIIAAGLVVFFSTRQSKEDVLMEIGKDYYETNYYPNNTNGKTDEEIKTQLQKYKNGIQINIENLKRAAGEKYKEKIEKTFKDNCDQTNTYIKFIPEEPYKVENYKIEVAVKCD